MSELWCASAARLYADVQPIQARGIDVLVIIKSTHCLLFVIVMTPAGVFALELTTSIV